jgi:hypothetical protein
MRIAKSWPALPSSTLVRSVQWGKRSITQSQVRRASQAGGLIAANTGVIGWFQFSGNTYLVEAINTTASAAAHATLAATDQVVDVAGFVNLSGEILAGHR